MDISEQPKQYQILSIMYEILIIVGYNEDEATQRLKSFVEIAEKKVFERVLNRLSPEAQNELESVFNATSSELTPEISQEEVTNQFQKHFQSVEALISHYIGKEELSILYFEVLSDLLQDYLKTVTPSLNDTQRELLETLLQGLN